MNPIRARVYAAGTGEVPGHVWMYEIRDNSRPEDHQILLCGMCPYWRPALNDALLAVPEWRRRDAEAKARAENA